MLSPRHRRLRVLRAGGIAVLVGMLMGEGGCGESTGPVDDENANRGDAFGAAVVVSDPQPISLAAGATGSEAGAAASSEEPIVHVSFPPGTVPGGETASIRNRATGLSLEAPVVNGGLDPVAVAANAGDTLEVVVVGATGELASGLFVVPIRLPPVVIRTDPPKRKVDVPLNAVLLVVFSEPIEPASLVGGVVLRHGATVVSGTVRPLSDGTAAEFLPEVLLERGTTYTLTINQGIRDLQGDTLAPQVDVEFTTGTSSAASIAVNLPADSPAVVVGARLALRALDRATGSPVSNVTWSTSDPSAATIDTAGLLTVLQPGLVTIRATSGRVSASAVITARTVQFDSIVAGFYTTCGLTADGEAFCWGTNIHGELGTDLPLPLPARQIATVPSRVAGGLKFHALALGGMHACGITIEGETYCWGSNRWGELGIGASSTGQVCGGGIATVPCSPVPVQVAGIPELREIRLAGWGGDNAERWGLGFSCGVALDGTAYCWGNNAFGQLGNGRIDGTGNESVQPTPEPVVISEPFQTVTLGPWAAWACGLTASGEVQCWGVQDWDMRGNEVMYIHEMSGTPVAIQGTWTGVAVGAMTACVRDTESAIHCWGYNRWATIADPPSDEFIVRPQIISSAGAPAASLDLGVGTACGLTSDGEAWCWGSNENGIIGTSEALETCQNFSDVEIPCTHTPVRGGWGLRFLTFSVGAAHACGIASDGVAYCWGLGSMGQTGEGAAPRLVRGLTRVVGQP